MDDKPVLIQLELTVAGGSVTGRASGETGPAREFSGRIGLITAIDALLELGGSEGTCAAEERA